MGIESANHHYSEDVSGSGGWGKDEDIGFMGKGALQDYDYHYSETVTF